MQNLQSTNLSSDVPLSKLLDIDSDLAAQEAQLVAELEAIQQKRKSLQTVLDLFSKTTASTAGTTVVPEQLATPESAISAIDVEAELPELEQDTPSAGVESNGTAPDTSPSRNGRRTKSTAKPAKNQTRSGKSTSRGQDLQQYVRSEFDQSSLSQAVGKVLQQQPNDVVGIPEIIDTIFAEDTPKQIRSVASNRISTILSTGLKANKWYRGKTGHYSISESAASADLKS